MGCMHDKLRTAAILLVLMLAASTPFVFSGYRELNAAEGSQTHIESAEHYLAAAKRLPWRRDLYELAGHHYYYAEEYSSAQKGYQKASRMRALSPDGWAAWGDVTYLSGDKQRATEIWETGLRQSNPSVNLYSRLAKIQQENGEFSKAADYLQQYVNIHQDDASARYRLGLLLTLSDPNAAVSELITASQLDPQFDPAAQTLRTAVNLSALDESESQQKVIIGRGLGLVNEWEMARAAFEDAVKFDEKNAEAWAWLGEANQQTGDALSESKGNKEALTYLNRALELDANSNVVRGLRGLYFQRVGNHHESLSEFQAAAKLDPQNPAWYVSVGEEFTKTGDLIRALEAYQYAATLAPTNVDYWRMLAVFSAQNNANVKDVGIPAAQKAVSLSPQDPLALDVLGWLLIQDGRYYEAERILNDAIEHYPQLASAQFHLALLYFQTGDRALMYDHLVKARDLGSEEAGLLLGQEFP